MEPTDCGEAYSERERRALRPAPDVGPGAMTVSNLCDRALGALVSNARPWNGTDAGGGLPLSHRHSHTPRPSESV